MTSRGRNAGPPASACVRWVSEASNVPAVRRYVGDLLADLGREDLVDDVALVATELAANTVMHGGSPYFEVEVSAGDDEFRLAVVNPGVRRAQAIAGGAEIAASGRALDPDSMTGRGLFLVASVARAWGIEDVPGGVRVWAEFTSGATDLTALSPRVVSGAPSAGTDADVLVIKLLGCPPDLLLAHDANLADIARELRLFGASHRHQEAAEMATQVAEVVRLSAVSWDAARLVAKQAIAQGHEEVDVATAPADVSDLPRKIDVLRRAVATAEALMADGLLMTTPASDAVKRWRDWVEEEMVQQATMAREPVRFSDWLAAAGRTSAVID